MKRACNPLYAFLKLEGWWIDGADRSRPVTHTFLDGGKACVRGKEELQRFHRAYADAVDAGHSQLAVERTGDAGFRMFMDIDVKGCDPRDDERVCAIARVVIRALPEPLRRGDVVVCLRRAIDSGGGGGGKHGAHLVWRDVAARDPKCAAAWRDACVRACEGLARLSGLALPEGASWDSVVDGAVYRRSGLRMLYSLKRGGESAYEPTYVADARTGSMRAVEPAEGSRVDWVERCSLHWDGGEEEAAKRLSDARMRDERLALDLEHHREDHREEQEDPACAGGVAPEHGPENLQRLRTILPAVYAGCRMEIVDDRTCARRLVIKTGSRYCHVACREHRGNHVYLVADAHHGLKQRCHCRCPGTACAAAAEPGGSGGHSLLPPEAIEFLFPPDAIENEKKEKDDKDGKKRKREPASVQPCAGSATTRLRRAISRL